MKEATKIAVWIDHNSAHLMELKSEPFEVKTIESNFDKNTIAHHNEKSMYSKEQHLMEQYYKKLVKVIRKYDSVVLFGPTDAKSELFNIIKTDHLLNNVQVEVVQTDKMTENQVNAFVRNYFTSFPKFVKS
ncbi:hypothetical protein [Flavobacterium sp.]|uniref:hypothetical protein n=1 Tax=Flavobacterium sp. TaxID=239 RepID=UPI002B4B6CA5|nr:hypothetical protein [Flavobacterium sp.]HLP64458.1 hypothetical protein [Flavobacterium sp.]